MWYRKSCFYGEIWSKNGRITSCQYSQVNWGRRAESSSVNERRYGRGSPVRPARATRHRLRQVKPSNFREGTYIFRDSSRCTESRHSQIASETHPRKIHHFTSTIVHHSHFYPHLIAIAIACNRDLLAIGDLVRIFGIDLSNSTMFSFIDLVIMSE